ncbi:MAG TPA: MBL fold metallo-hydrolase [Polyangiaceae bacterium]|nr:MBL fold metallo-hydrolase [Polyangiaceae bacterium]
MRKSVRWGGAALLGLLTLGLTGFALVVRSKRSQADPVERVENGVFRARNFLSDIYAARVGGHVLLFDAGLDPEGHAADALLSTLHARREDVSHVFLTHGHADHVAAAGLFPKAHIYVGAGDAAVLEHPELAEPRTPRWFGALMGRVSVHADRPLSGPTTVEVGEGRVVRAIPFPGHTPGSFVYWFERVLFTGDSVGLDRRVPPDGVLTAAQPRHSVDVAGNHESIRALPKWLAKDEVEVLCTGHMGCTRAQATRPLLDRLLAETK